MREFHLPLPCFASVLGENGEFDTGIIFHVERSEDRVFLQTLFIENSFKHPKGRKIEISYEENYNSNLKVQGEIISSVQFYIYNVSPANVIQVYSDSIKIPNLSKDVKIRRNLLFTSS